jgi:hypothetical protein
MAIPLEYSRPIRSQSPHTRAGIRIAIHPLPDLPHVMTELDCPTAIRSDAFQAVRRREQRLEPRKAVQLSAVLLPHGGRAIRATIVNLSKHGVEVICLVDLRPATKCRLRFTSSAGPQPQVVRAHACVVRSCREGSGYRIGLLLSAATPRANDLLEYLANS